MGRRARHRHAIGVAVAVALFASGCQPGITDVGSVEEDALDRPAAFEGLVNGMGRTLSSALGHIAMTGGAVAREVVASGSHNAFGVTHLQRQGILAPGSVETDEHWKLAHQARWVAEDGVRRMREVLGERFASSPVAARALLYVGFSNRLLGENMCHSVIDGGPPRPASVHLARAEAAFTEAMEIGEKVGDAEIVGVARAGRATVRVGLDDWPGAAADAAAVPQGIGFQAKYSANELAQYNRIHWATAGHPYRSLSVWSTFYANYHAETGDPRTPWTLDPEVPEGEAGVPLYTPRKYPSRDTPIDLVDAREARLIVAEAQLRVGDVSGALAEINALRAAVEMEPWDVEDAEEAWTALKRERGIELWLEGRRLADLERWIDEGVPGSVEDMTGRSLCFPIGRTEVDTNPNVP